MNLFSFMVPNYSLISHDFHHKLVVMIIFMLIVFVYFINSYVIFYSTNLSIFHNLVLSVIFFYSISEFNVNFVILIFFIFIKKLY